MTHSNLLIDKLNEGNVALGLAYTYPAAGIIEAMLPGWDFVWIDGQHGQLSYDSCLHAVHASAVAGVETVLRIPGHETGIIGPFADLWPSAIMVPMVNSDDDAAAVVDGLRFPPLGIRSYGGRRGGDVYGRGVHVERPLLTIAQIETLEAVDNAEAIINRDGIDMLFFGPDDMKLRMGIDINTPLTEHPQLRRAMERTAEVALAAGKFCGTVTIGAAAARMAVDMGYRLLAGGTDSLFIRTCSAQRLAELRGETT